MNETQQKIDDLLVDWESARLSGVDLSAAELCKQHPHLLRQVAAKIEVLKNLSWVGDPFELIADKTPPTIETKPADGETKLKADDLTVNEFVAALSDSGILDKAKLAIVNAEAKRPGGKSENQARDLALRLVAQKLITEYQANVILERGDSPLLLDRYVILDSIGAGGMGIVFKALQVSLDRVVAVKVLPQHFVDSADKVERFQREMRSVAKISHPNVVQAYDAHESNGVYFFAMEYVPGLDLAAKVQADGPFPASSAANICSQIAEGLASAHSNGIVHRDIKPGNVLLSTDGVAKVLDLGLARTRERAQDSIENDLTRDGLAMGTVAYMSPEQAFDAKSADEQSDIYSLGCTLYFLIHGRPMFENENSVRTIVAHRETPPPKLSEGRSDVSPRLEELFQQMVAKRPADRPNAMKEVHAAFARVASAGSKSNTPLPPKRPANTGRHSASSLASNVATQSKPVPPPVANPTAKTNQSSLWKWIAAGLAMALMLSIGLILGGDSGRSKETPESLAARQNVEELLSYSATMTAYHDGEPYLIEDIADLPPSPFSITDVDVYSDDTDQLTALTKLSDLLSLTITQPDGEPLPLDSALLDELDLVDLTIFGCKLDEEDLERIGAMINLDTLHLTGCRLPKDLTPLTQLDGLSTLSLDETDVSESQLDTLTQFNDLRFLDLSYTQLPASSIPKLAEITTLRDLLLHDMPVDSAAESFANMPRIKQLDLSSSDISDKGLEQLLGCKKLEIVVAVDTQLTDEAIDRFEQQHPIAAVLTEFVDEMEFGEMEE